MAKDIEPGVRLPVELYETLKRMAAKNGRSLNAEIVAALDDYAMAFCRYEQRRDEFVQQHTTPLSSHYVAGGSRPLFEPPKTSFERGMGPSIR